MNGIKAFPFGKGSISFVSLISRFSRFAICSEISSFSFLEFPETFKLFSSCPSSFHLPEVSRLPFAGFLCYEIFMVRIPFGISSPALGELFYFISFQAVCQELFSFFSAPLAAPAASLRQLVYITRSPPPCQSLFLSFLINLKALM